MTALVPGNLPISQCREELSLAFLHAIATAARCGVEVTRVDYFGVDATVRHGGEHAMYSKVPLDIQLKCTSRDVVKRSSVAYPLRISHYDELRDARRFGKVILVVVIVPVNLNDWVQHWPRYLHLAGHAYWRSLRGSMPSSNSTTQTVQVPMAQRFTTNGLLEILQRIGDGGDP